MENPYQPTAIQILVQLEVKPPTVIVRGIQKIWGKSHEQSELRHRQSEFNTIDVPEYSHQHLGDLSSHDLVRSSTNLATQGSSDGQSGHIQGQSGFSTNERQVYSHGQSRDSYEQSSGTHSLDSQVPLGTEENSFTYLSSSVTHGVGKSKSKSLDQVHQGP